MIELLIPVAYLLGMVATTWLLGRADVHDQMEPQEYVGVIAFWPVTAVVAMFIKIFQHGKKRRKK